MPATSPMHVSILGLPEASHSTVAGLADVFSAFRLLRGMNDSIPDNSPFEVCIVGCETARTAAMPFRIEKTIGEISHTNIVIVPALLVSTIEWLPDNYSETLDWMKAMHAGGAMLCSACSGALLLAQTGVLKGGEATTHWAYADLFRKHFPEVRLRLEHLLVRTGQRGEIAMSGASGSWHDLALYLIANHVSLAAAQTIAKFLLLEWHVDGQTPFMTFTPHREHADAIVRQAQEWLDTNLSEPNPVERVVHYSGLPGRTFKRRFMRAVGYTPIRYVQQLRIEAAKRRLERTVIPVDRVASLVGYEDPAFFRRLFKRVTGISPAAYRRKLQLPDHLQKPGRK